MARKDFQWRRQRKQLTQIAPVSAFAARKASANNARSRSQRSDRIDQSIDITEVPQNGGNSHAENPRPEKQRKTDKVIGTRKEVGRKDSLGSTKSYMRSQIGTPCPEDSSTKALESRSGTDSR